MSRVYNLTLLLPERPKAANRKCPVFPNSVLASPKGDGTLPSRLIFFSVPSHFVFLQCPLVRIINNHVTTMVSGVLLC